MIVGPTVLIVSIGTGAPARIDSSKKMNCSIGRLPWPPHSVGQPMPAHPSAHICFHTRRGAGPTPPLCGELGHGVRVEQPVVVGAQLGSQRLLLGGEAEVQ